MCFRFLADGRRARQKIAGDLAISVPTARRQAAEQGHSLATEIKVLILHGLLHLAGYDHETDDGRDGAARAAAARAARAAAGADRASESGRAKCQTCERRTP